MEFKDVTFEELEKVSKPLIQLLKEKGHPNMSVIVRDNSIRIVEDVVFLPTEEKRLT